MSHLPSNTTSLDFSAQAARAIKGIQGLPESDEDALDYANLSKYLALASQEEFPIAVSFDGEVSQRH